MRGTCALDSRLKLSAPSAQHSSYSGFKICITHLLRMCSIAKLLFCCTSGISRSLKLSVLAYIPCKHACRSQHTEMTAKDDRQVTEYINETYVI
jgi:hypothetical protein